MADNRITIQLVGSQEDEGHLRLSAFIAQLEAVKSALRQTERLITGEDDPSVYYRVVDLHHSSPATVVLEARSSFVENPPPTTVEKRRRAAARADYSGATVQQFFHSLREIREKKQRPARTDLQALESYRNLTATLDKSVSGIRLVNTEDGIDIDREFRTAIDDIIGPDELLDGSIYGMLERINLHNTTRFDVFPVIGPKQVSCDFHPSLREAVIKAIDKHVCVSGKLRYKRLENFPHAIDADRIEVLPTDEDLPTLFDLKGISPNLTGDLSAEDFMRSIRDAEAW